MQSSRVKNKMSVDQEGGGEEGANEEVQVQVKKNKENRYRRCQASDPSGNKIPSLEV